VDAAEHDVRADLPGRDADLVASESVTCVDADPDDVPGRDDRRVEAFERLVDQQWRAERLRVAAARTNQRGVMTPMPNDVTRVDEVDVHRENTTTAHLDRASVPPARP
jgi:hypothetical protein